MLQRRALPLGWKQNRENRSAEGSEEITIQNGIEDHLPSMMHGTATCFFFFLKYYSFLRSFVPSFLPSFLPRPLQKNKGKKNAETHIDLGKKWKGEGGVGRKRCAPRLPLFRFPLFFGCGRKEFPLFRFVSPS